MNGPSDIASQPDEIARKVASNEAAAARIEAEYRAIDYSKSAADTLLANLKRSSESLKDATARLAGLAGQVRAKCQSAASVPQLTPSSQRTDLAEGQIAIASHNPQVEQRIAAILSSGTATHVAHYEDMVAAKPGNEHEETNAKELRDAAATPDALGSRKQALGRTASSKILHEATGERKNSHRQLTDSEVKSIREEGQQLRIRMTRSQMNAEAWTTYVAMLQAQVVEYNNALLAVSDREKALQQLLEEVTQCAPAANPSEYAVVALSTEQPYAKSGSDTSTLIDHAAEPAGSIQLNYAVNTPAGGSDAPIWTHSREQSSAPQKQESFSSVIIHEDSVPHTQAGGSFPQTSPAASCLQGNAPISMKHNTTSAQASQPPMSASSCGSSQPAASVSVASDPTTVNASTTGHRSKTPPGHNSLSPSGAAVSESEATEDERELSPAHPGEPKKAEVRRGSPPGTIVPRTADRQSCCCIQ